MTFPKARYDDDDDDDANSHSVITYYFSDNAKLICITAFELDNNLGSRCFLPHFIDE